MFINGAKVGNKTVFTKEGAIEVFKIACEVCLKNKTIESLIVLGDFEDDMLTLGFEYEELLKIEVMVLEDMEDAS